MSYPYQVDAGEFADFMEGMFGAMLFTAGHLSDNHNAPADYSSDDVPDYHEHLSVRHIAELEEAADGFLRTEGVETRIRASGALGMTWKRAGEVFHYARNGHGVTFEDGEWSGGAELQEAARPFGECELETIPDDPEHSNDGPLYTDENGKWSLR
jgi:hypothetical protein